MTGVVQTHKRAETDLYILWLPSWYPNKYEPFNGDFVQRHARAAALHCSIVVCHFPQLGHKVRVDTSYSETTQSPNLKEVVHYIAFKPYGNSLFDKIRYNITYYRSTSKYLKEYFKTFGLPELVHVHVPMKAGNLAVWIKKKFKVNYILSEHASFYSDPANDNNMNRNIFHARQVKNIFRKASAVTNVSDSIGNILRSLFTLKKVHVIYNVVDTTIFNLAATKPNTFTFIHVSTLIDQKNIEGILKVFRDLLKIDKNWTLKLVGPPNDIMQQRLLEYNLTNNVELAGEVQYTEVGRYMKEAHALVMFSRHENFPCVIIEALCCGLPVISSDVGGIKEAIDNSNGILVSSENEVELLNAIQQMRKSYAAYDLPRISEEASNKYNYSNIGRQICNLYNNICAEKVR